MFKFSAIVLSALMMAPGISVAEKPANLDEVIEAPVERSRWRCEAVDQYTRYYRGTGYTRSSASRDALRRCRSRTKGDKNRCRVLRCNERP